MSDFFSSDGFDFHIERVTFEHARKLGMNDYSQGNRLYNQLVYKIDGGSHQFIDGFNFELTPGSVMFIPRSVKSHSDDIYSLGSTINIAFDIYDDERYNFRPSIINIGGDDRFFKLEAAHHLGRGFRTQAIFAGILDRLTHFSEHGYLDSKKYTKIVPAIDYIEKHCFTEQITVEHLCELCGISGEYLRRLFRRFMGKTPIEYINVIRLENARVLLQTRKFSVTEAAISSGFDNISYFSRIYSRRYGHPPSEELISVMYMGSETIDQS